MRRQVKAPGSARAGPGPEPGLLKELHLLTRDGDLNADSLRKLKQVNHLVAAARAGARGRARALRRPGAGRLRRGQGLPGLHPLRAVPAGRPGRGRSSRRRGAARADRAAAEERARPARLRRGCASSTAELEAARAAGAGPPRHRAARLRHGHRRRAASLAIRHERRPRGGGALLPGRGGAAARGAEAAPTRPSPRSSQHPWHRREFGSHLTNVIRALALEAHGYQVTVTELTGWEHSLKNELILGKKVRARSARGPRAARGAARPPTGVRPKLVPRALWT